MPKRLVVLLSLLPLLSSCAAQKTVFYSDPPGARISVNGEFIGETPCEFEYRAGAGTIYEVAVQKENYQPLEGPIATDAVDEETRGKWLVAGLVWSPLWLGTVFTKKLQASYHFALTRILGAEGSDEAAQKTAQAHSGKEQGAPADPVPEGGAS